jgi:hypothetical protein
MRQTTIRFLRTTFAVAFGVAAINTGHQAFANEQGMNLKEQLFGTWTLRELYAVTWDDEDRNPFGTGPQGRLIFDRAGNVTCVIIGGDRHKFALGNRLSGTSEENRAAVQSAQAFYGRYRVDEDNRTVAFEIERSIFPNWDGTSQLSVMVIDGDTLNQTKPGPRGSWGYAVWERAADRKVVLND